MDHKPETLLPDPRLSAFVRASIETHFDIPLPIQINFQVQGYPYGSYETLFRSFQLFEAGERSRDLPFLFDLII